MLQFLCLTATTSREPLETQLHGVFSRELVISAGCIVLTCSVYSLGSRGPVVLVGREQPIGEIPVLVVVGYVLLVQEQHLDNEADMFGFA